MKHNLIEACKFIKLRFSPALHRDGTKAPNLIDVILQGFNNQAVLFTGSMNNEAWEETRRSKRVVLYSKSRKELWLKGKTSGSELEVIAIYVNCEQNALLIKVRLLGQGACHTKNKSKYRKSCFYRKLENGKLIFVD